MKPERAESVALVVGFLAIVAGVLAFDWRLGLLVAGVLLCASALDIRWRRA
jgi:hypothetical protein